MEELTLFPAGNDQTKIHSYSLIKPTIQVMQAGFTGVLTMIMGQ